MKKDLLVTLADKKYINQAKQLFSSVYFNAGWKGDYMLLAHEIPEKDLKWFRKKGILIKKCKPLSSKNLTRWAPVVLDKFYLFKTEFRKWRKIVYLDADIIVTASFNEILNVNQFGAVLDAKSHEMIRDQFFKKTKTNQYLIEKLEKEYNTNEKAFNAGMFVFDTKIIKKYSFEKLLNLLNTHEDICNTGEQPLLNLYFYKKWEQLHPVYNNYLSAYTCDKRKIKGIILHFLYWKRPWFQESCFYNTWIKNLENAENINTKKPIPPKEVWSEKKIKKYSSFLRFMYYLYYLRNELKDAIMEIKRVSYYIKCAIHFILGKCGIFLKKYSPRIYTLLKQTRLF